MFTEQAKEYLDKLTYKASAERDTSNVPLGGIYWKDEIPDWDAFHELPEEDKNNILRLFSIRFEIWDGTVLSAESAAYWAEARSLFPRCPIFQRLMLSADDKQAQEAVMKEAESFLDALFSGATDLTLADGNGITQISGTYRLSSEGDSDKQPN